MAKSTLLSQIVAIVEVLLTLTDNSNYFSECVFWSLPNVSWQIIKKKSGLFDTETKYKSVFLATIKGASFVQVKFLHRKECTFSLLYAACSEKVRD